MHFPRTPPRPLFTAKEQQDAFDALGANCGPGAIAAMCGSTPRAVALLLGDEFQERKGTTEIMAQRAIKALGFSCSYDATPTWPAYGLARILWDGPWTLSSHPYSRYKHSHWIGVFCVPQEPRLIFDINAIAVGGWLPFAQWARDLAPLLAQQEKNATGTWTLGDSLHLHLNITGL